MIAPALTSGSRPETTRAGIAREYDKTFLLDEARLRKLASILEEYAAKLEPAAELHFEVTRRDESFYETTEIGVVLSDDNTPAKAIVALELRLAQAAAQLNALAPEEPKTVARVTFGAEARDRSFRLFPDETSVRFVVIERNRDWCFLLADELDGQINRVLASRGRWLPVRILDRLVPFAVFAGAFVWGFRGLFAKPIGYTAAQIAAMSIDQRTQATLELLIRQESNLGWRVPATFLVVGVGFVLAELKPLRRLWRRVYAPTFYWGDMVAVRNRADRIVNNIKWSVIAAFAVSIVASFAYTWMTRK